jgi:hypothetical protein
VTVLCKGEAVIVTGAQRAVILDDLLTRKKKLFFFTIKNAEKENSKERKCSISRQKLKEFCFSFCYGEKHSRLRLKVC